MVSFSTFSFVCILLCVAIVTFGITGAVLYGIDRHQAKQKELLELKKQLEELKDDMTRNL